MNAYFVNVECFLNSLEDGQINIGPIPVADRPVDAIINNCLCKDVSIINIQRSFKHIFLKVLFIS